MKRIFLLFLFLFMSSFALPFSIHAQTNTYSCIYVNNVCGLNPASIDCFSNYVPWNDCIGQPDAGSCQRLFPCRLIVAPPTNTPGPGPGSGLSPLCGSGNGVSTPFGCLPFTGGSGPAKTMIEYIINWAIGLAALICLFTLIYASFQIVTAAGDAKRVQAGRELLTAAIGGMILIVTGVLVLNFLGVKILGLDLLGFQIP